jgi:hypothetical protein
MSEEDLSSATSESTVDDTPSEAGSEPTPEVRTESIEITTQWLDNFHIESEMSGHSTNGTPTGSGGTTKVNPPAEFTGRRDQIKSFQLQCKLYWEMHPEKFLGHRKRVLFALSYFRGKALEWIQPHMEDFIDHPSGEGAKEGTAAILGSSNRLFASMKEVFDVGNDTLEADRDLRVLRQRTSAAAYRAEFSILAAKVGWNDDALASQFYRGLKDQVRTEITMHHERPSTLKGMADLAMQIDSRIFEVQLEKKGSYFQGKPNSKVQRDVPAWKDNYYGLQKMQIDATTGKPGSNNKGPKKGQNKRPQPKTKGTTDKSNVECYGCGKKGHYKSECNARKQRHELQGSGQRQSQENSFRATKGSDKEVVDTARVESIKATQGRGAYQDMEQTATEVQDTHAAVSWTACYDDDCAIHMSDKYGSGYWPAKRTRSVYRVTGQPSQAVRFEGGHPSPEDSSTDEESDEDEGQVVRYPAGYPPQTESTEEEEESSDEEGEVSETEEVDVGRSPGVTEFARTFYADDPILRLLEAVADSRTLLLPWDAEGRIQKVDESELWELFTRMRRVLWNVPHVKNSIDYHRIVQEYPPLGSRFTDRGGYFTPDNVCVTRTMRMRVMEVKNEYATERKEQSDRVAQQAKATVEVRELATPIIPEEYLEEPLEVRRRPLQNRPPTPYAEERSVWEPPLNTSDPNYVPRRPISMQGPHAGSQLDPRRQLVIGRTTSMNPRSGN